MVGSTGLAPIVPTWYDWSEPEFLSLEALLKGKSSLDFALGIRPFVLSTLVDIVQYLSSLLWHNALRYLHYLWPKILSPVVTDKFRLD